MSQIGSNRLADGRKMTMNMLDRRYMDEQIREYCQDPPDEMNWDAHVFLGVAGDPSKELGDRQTDSKQ